MATITFRDTYTDGEVLYGVALERTKQDITDVINAAGGPVMGTNDSTITGNKTFSGVTTFSNSVDFQDIVEFQQGADVASVAGTMTLGDDGNIFEISGTNSITSITIKNAGTVVVLIFLSTAKLIDGSNLDIRGDFNAAAQDVITLVSDGTNWVEVARSQGVPIGSINMYGASSAPSGWLLCDGTAVSRTTYASLFAVISTTYGTGDGSTTFNVPDLRGRAPIGLGTGSGLTARSLNDAVGTETHALSEAELASHSHIERYPTGNPDTAGTGIDNLIYKATDGGGLTTRRLRSGTTNIQADETTSSATVSNVTTATTGSGTAHQNMQPSRCLNFIIKF